MTTLVEFVVCAILGAIIVIVDALSMAPAVSVIVIGSLITIVGIIGVILEIVKKG